MSRAEEIFNDIESKYAAGQADFHADTSVYNALINCESYDFFRNELNPIVSSWDCLSNMC